MALHDQFVSTYFGLDAPPKTIGVGLALGGKELSAKGYTRGEVQRGRWQIRRSAASTMVRFGPFGESVDFDAVLLMNGGEVLEVLRLTEPVHLLAGMVLEHEVEVSVDA